ncbi:MAG: RDD family protein [bacterium]
MARLSSTGRQAETPIIGTREVSSLPGRLASVKRRFAALVIDDIILAFITIFLAMLSGFTFTIGAGSFPGSAWANATFSTSIKMIYFIVWLTYHTVFLGSTGQTPGKKALGLRVIRTGGEKISYARALGRTLGYIPSSLLYIGYIWAIWDRRKQAWHDKFVDTVVIKV